MATWTAQASSIRPASKPCADQTHGSTPPSAIGAASTVNSRRAKMPRDRSIGIARRQDRPDRLVEDVEVERHRPVADVVDIHLDPLDEGRPIPAGHLPEAGDAGFHLEHEIYLRSEEHTAELQS